MMNYENSLEFAKKMDLEDPLSGFREKFNIPKVDGKESIYLTGNSLGAQPKSVRKAIEQELEDWAELGVEGHFHGKNPWMHYHKFLTEPAARIVGGLPKEVVVMNNLTVNLHLMMVSFYRPTSSRYKIMMEASAFPSDQYAVESQVKYHGYAPDDAIIEVKPREGEHTIRTEDILSLIEENKDTLALVMFGGVNYYTGQAFDMKAITGAAHSAGAFAGFDLAHAAGNITLELHDWDVDFATWCSYKYLNSGPGGTSGVFVNERHSDNPEIPRFAGWWGHKEDVRFKMQKGFIPEEGAAGWQLSNAQIFPMAIHKASLEIFEEAGMENLRAKSEKLTGYLEFILNDINGKKDQKEFEIITPADPSQRGCQLSVLVKENGRELFDFLGHNGVIADWREPNVIRMAPVPLYNTFEDVFRLGQILAGFRA